LEILALTDDACKAMTVTVSYDMYLEVCKGNLDPALKVEKAVTFFHWREKLAK